LERRAVVLSLLSMEALQAVRRDNPLRRCY